MRNDPDREPGWKPPPRPWAVPASDLGGFVFETAQRMNLVYVLSHRSAFTAKVRERAQADLDKLDSERRA